MLRRRIVMPPNRIKRVERKTREEALAAHATRLEMPSSPEATLLPVPSNPCCSHFEHVERAQKDAILLRWMAPRDLVRVHGLALTPFAGTNAVLSITVNGETVHEFTLVTGLNRLDFDAPVPVGTCLCVRLVSGIAVADLWLSVSGEC